VISLHISFLLDVERQKYLPLLFSVIVLTVHFYTSLLFLRESTEVKCRESDIASLS